VKRHRFFFVAVDLCIVLLTGSLVGLHAAPCQASVFSTSGAAEYAPPGSSSFSPLQKGQILDVGTTIRTGDDGTAIIVTTPGSAITVGSDTKLKLNVLAFAKSGDTVTQREAHIELTSGVVGALIDPKTPQITDFKIQTPQGGASARGTSYAVAVVHGKTYVSVLHGKVGVGALGSGHGF
jgi:hypothetical protein